MIAPILLAFGIPFVYLIRKARLYTRRKQDYLHYLEYKGLRVKKGLMIKPLIFAGAWYALSSLPSDVFVIFYVIMGVAATLAELILNFNYAHILPNFKPHVLCDCCKENRHSMCTNLRSLEDPVKLMSRKISFFTPVCCCGFVLNRKESILSFCKL